MNSVLPATFKRDLFSKTAVVVLLLCIALAAVLYLLPNEAAMRLAAESGPIESLQALLVLAGALFALIQLARFRTLPWAAAFLAFAWMFLREMDVQRNFTPVSVESIRFYKSADINIQLKLLVLLILLPFVAAIFYLAALAVRRFRPHLQERRAWPHCLLWAGILLVIGRSTEKLGLDSSAVIEEVCELGFELFLVLILVDCSRHSSRRSLLL